MRTIIITVLAIILTLVTVTPKQTAQNKHHETSGRMPRTAFHRQPMQSTVATYTAPVEPPKPTYGGGSKEDWMSQAGIDQSVWGMVDYLVTKESGWNPNAVNKSSGACGLGQQLPCGKWAGAWNDPISALRAMNGYVQARYGGWPGAVGHSKAKGWY